MPAPTLPRRDRPAPARSEDLFQGRDEPRVVFRPRGRHPHEPRAELGVAERPQEYAPIAEPCGDHRRVVGREVGKEGIGLGRVGADAERPELRGEPGRPAPELPHPLGDAVFVPERRKGGGVARAAA